MGTICIKNVSKDYMPVTCCHCPLKAYDENYKWNNDIFTDGAWRCQLTGELIDNTKREYHCPLQYVEDNKSINKKLKSLFKNIFHRK